MRPAVTSRVVGQIDPSQIREIGKLADMRPDCLRLHFGESSQPTPEFIKDAAAKALGDGYTFYTPNSGYLELRETIAESIVRLHDTQLDPEREIVVTAGGVMAIYLAMRSLVDPGDEVVLISPAWPNVRQIVTLTGARPVQVPLRLAGKTYRLDPDLLAAAITPKTRVLFVNSPANPTGWVIAPEEQEAVRDLVLGRRLMLISDEVYERLVFDEPVAASMSRFRELRDRLVIVNSFSKTYNMTGWRVAYAAGPREVMDAMATLQEFVVSHAPAVSQRAAIAALRQGDSFVESSRCRCRGLRDVACRELAGIPGLELALPQGTFYLFVRIFGIADSLAFARELVLRHGVAVAPGTAFGEGGDASLRICFGVDESILREALARLRRSMADLPAGRRLTGGAA